MYRIIWWQKTLIFSLSLLTSGLLPTSPVYGDAAEDCLVERADIRGLNRTDKDWFQEYFDLHFPKRLSGSDTDGLRARIMTTEIFSESIVKIAKTPQGPCVLEIDLSEKWTTIPVIRAAYGGGTPLAVAGGYETHAFGKLRLLGAEARRYGNRPPGFFAFAKSPRAWNGLGSAGAELWLDRRRRAFFHTDSQRQETEIAAYADSEAWTGKFQLLYPLAKTNAGTPIQVGFHMEAIRESPSTIMNKDLETAPALKPNDVDIPDSYQQTMVIMPMLAVDQITVDRLTMDGARATFKAGAQLTDHSQLSASEFEGFFFKRMPDDVNLALHGFAGMQNSHSLRNLYFLGGFDSVRGLPDGIHYGTRMIYGNLEVRHHTFTSRYLEAQAALFLDHGSAFSNADEWGDGKETALGIGMRISVPQVYRLLIRIDYGWSIGKTKSHGFSIGLGQFFQPYKLFF